MVDSKISDSRKFKPAIGWFLLIGVLWYWNWVQIEQSITRIAKAEAYASAGKDILYHGWAGLQGGVYVRPTKATPPNPYLAFLSEQTIRTTVGEEFTLVNPAYMVRQVNELGQSITGRIARLTSLHPIRPENAPDSWEAEALHVFENHPSHKEIYSVQTINDHEYLRILRPMYAVQACIKCHPKGGYHLQVDDLRGGISVSVDFEPYASAILVQRVRMSVAYLLIWLAGQLGLCVWTIKNNHFINKLRDRSEQLRTLIDAAPDLICLKDGKGRWLEANTVTVYLFELTTTEFTGKTDIELAETSCSRLRNVFLTCAENDEKTWQARENQQTEEIIETVDGRERIFDVIKAPIFNKDGSRQGIIVWGRDITERKRNDAERQLLISAIEQTAESVVVTDTTGGILYVNSACSKTSGYSREELLGQHPSIFKSDVQDEPYYKTLWETITSGKVWSGRIVNRKKTGELFTEEMTISPVRNEDGIIVHFVAVKQDISDQIMLENAKEQIELQFQQAQKMETVGRLAGGIAHDLNNLLTPMLGYSELLLFNKDKLLPQQIESVEQIQLAGQRARDIVQRLLTFSRKQSFQLEPVQINEVICGFQKLLHRTIRENIMIDLLLAPENPVIMADSGSLEQIIMNLAINAQDVMPDSGLLVIETRVVDAEDIQTFGPVPGIGSGKYVVMAVSDSGTGMNQETLNSVFEPFFTTKEKDKGTGLGLSTVYGFVKQFNGEIRAFSAPGQGTNFFLYFPMVEGKDVQQISPGIGVQDEIEESNAATIMIVDDDENVRSFTTMALQSRGFKVISAIDGQEALSKFEEIGNEIDLLISDVIMPGLDGRNLYGKLLAGFPDLRVVFLSGYTQDILHENNHLGEHLHFLKKPFSIHELFNTVTDSLG